MIYYGHAKVAQLVEHSTENAGVVSSILSLGTFFFWKTQKRVSIGSRSISGPVLFFAILAATATSQDKLFSALFYPDLFSIYSSYR